MFAADGGIGAFGVFGVAGEDPLAVADEGDREAVDFGDAGVDFTAVVGAVFHEFAVVGEAGEDLHRVVGAFLVGGEDHVEVFAREFWILWGGDAEHGRVVGRHHAHVLFDAVEDAGFSVVDFPEVGGLVEVGFDPAGVFGFEVFGAADECLGGFDVDVPFGVHAADDAGTADGDVGPFVGDEDGGADPLVAAAGGVGAVDAVQYRDA